MVGATLAIRAGMPTHEASFGDHGVTRVGAAAVPPEVQPDGRSVSRRSTAVPRAAVFDETGADLWDEDVEDAAADAADAPTPSPTHATTPP